MINIDNFSYEKECRYHGETYSVRDNGAVKRHTQLGKKIAERTSLKRQTLEAEKNKKENIPILNPEEIASIQNSTLQRQQQVEADTKEVTRLQELLSLTETLQEKQTKFPSVS